MRPRYLAAAAVLTAGVFAGCGSRSPTSPTATTTETPAIAALVEEIRGGAFGDIKSLLLAQGDSAAREYYFGGSERGTAAPIYSITKSITSLLAGMAIADGAITTVDARLTTILRSRVDLLRADPLREQLTVKDLLTMRGGITWNEFAAPYDTPGNPVTQMLMSPDWIANVLQRPMATVPGTQFAYNSGLTVVLGEAVHEATTLDLEVYAERRLLGPLGIPSFGWHRGPAGVVNAGGGLSLRPIDLLTIGLLVRDRGRARSSQLIPESWIAESLSPATPASLGAAYGYQWWLLGPNGAWDPTQPVYAAIGWGGQLILVFPDKDAVAVVTAVNFSSDALVAAQTFTRRIAAGL